MNIKEKIKCLKNEQNKYKDDSENYGIYVGISKAIDALESEINKELTKKYILTVTQDENGLDFSATNDGFHAFELIGFLEVKKQDIYLQIKGEIKPEIEFKRKVIKES